MDMFVICVCLCYTVLSVSCSLVVTCWERADPLALLCVIFSCVFVTFPHDVLVQVWHFIVSIPGLCFLTYLEKGLTVLDSKPGTPQLSEAMSLGK